jgi:hypothetical protein
MAAHAVLLIALHLCSVHAKNIIHGDNLQIRILTYLDEDDEFVDERSVGTSFVAGFSMLTVGFITTALISIKLTRQCQEFYEWNAIRLIFPWVSLVLAVQCATLAYDAGEDRTVNGAWATLVYMIQTTIAPSLFLITYVLTYLAHRTRSIPFCVVYRSQSHFGQHDPTDEELTQRLVRPATATVLIRLFSLGILVLSLIVDFDILWEQDDLAGRTGWSTVITNPWSDQSLHIVLGLLPMTLVGLFCLYFSLLLWRYGTWFSMIINASSLNPWLYPLLGIILLMGGQCVGPKLFPILSNAGILLYVMSISRLLLEVQRDMHVSSELGNYLDALGDDVVAGSTMELASPRDDKGSRSSNFLEQKEDDSLSSIEDVDTSTEDGPAAHLPSFQ